MNKRLLRTTLRFFVMKIRQGAKTTCFFTDVFTLFITMRLFTAFAAWDVLFFFALRVVLKL